MGGRSGTVTGAFQDWHRGLFRTVTGAFQDWQRGRFMTVTGAFQDWCGGFQGHLLRKIILKKGVSGILDN